ncbi:hypothetical protein PRIPAC_90664 [Pristionchus pacificus]|uniref:Uncharacterized protein n=1 Tax=Pristionchus pacificus TaxID=54126 RepID=A0A2A6B7Q9_PRIPA|nr:hypothetical protein PRIPAC_90664 [Pristionchus pacificus]|eukprot:PDM61893.1 hypothetical protein PRIPAC_51335 [Pristionchus pacificus]
MKSLLISLIFLVPLIVAVPLKRDDLSTTVTARLLCHGKPYLDGRIRLVVGKKKLEEGRALANGSYTVSASKYTAAYGGEGPPVIDLTRLMNKAGVQIFHTCNRKNCWEQVAEIQIPNQYVSTSNITKKPYDMGRIELDARLADVKLDCVKMK